MKRKRLNTIFTALTVLTAILMLGFGSYALSSENTMILGGVIVITEIFILQCLVPVIYSKINSWNRTKETKYREYLVNELSEDNKNSKIETEIIEPQGKIEIGKRNEKRDIIALMLKNNDEITEYFTISKSQAKSSYWFSVFSSVIGMIMIGIAIYSTVVNKNAEVAIIGVVSGSITEVIAGIVLWIHNKSAMQLNHYYDALHENEKFLSAINMADKLSDEKKEKMYIEIIRKQIDISVDKEKEEN